MAKLVESFDELLSAIEPGKKAIEYASKAHTRIREHLEKDEGFKEFFGGSFLYGSYRRSTAVGDIKDVDIVLLTSFDPAAEKNTPQYVLRKVKEALNRYYKDSDNQQYQRRSIRVDDPLPDEKDSKLTLDIIPAFAPNGDEDALLVPDREFKKWVLSHPKGHIKHATMLNDEDHGNGMYIPLVKIMKYWWKYQCEIKKPNTERPKPKGFWAECLTGENFDESQDDFASHFIKTLENISNKYSRAVSVPKLSDPGLPEKTIMTSMTMEEFEFFLNTINACLALAKDAYNEENEEKSAKIWQEIFGEAFPASFSEKDQTKSIAKRDPGEEFLSDYEIKEKISYRLKINATVTQNGFRPFKLLGTKNPLRKKRELKFVIEYCDVPQPYEVKWKVKNYGNEAHSVDDLRGGILNDKGFHNRDENTKYEGAHYVECYAIKDGHCLAKDRIEVPVGRH